jgi:hypothetical protein
MINSNARPFPVIQWNKGGRGGNKARLGARVDIIRDL